MPIPKILETYIDGLDAFGDGRGFGAEHEKARRYVEEAVRYATIRRDALQQILNLNDLDAIKDLAHAALKESES